MQFVHLETFLAVVEEGSFAAAAKRLYVAPSRVTERLQQLEAELHVELLNRSSRQLKPTQAGLALVPRAQAVVRELRTIRTLFPEDATPHVTVGMRSVPMAFRDTVKSDLENAVAGIAGVSILPLDSESQIQQMLTGQLDCGFIWTVPPSPLIAFPVLRESIAIVVPANVKFTSRDRLAPEDLSGLRLASTVDPLTIPADIGAYLDYLPHCDRVNPAVLGGLYTLVSSGHHCAFISEKTIDHLLVPPETRRNIVIKQLLEPVPATTTYFAWHPELESQNRFAPVLAWMRSRYPHPVS